MPISTASGQPPKPDRHRHTLTAVWHESPPTPVNEVPISGSPNSTAAIRRDLCNKFCKDCAKEPPATGLPGLRQPTISRLVDPVWLDGDAAYALVRGRLSCADAKTVAPGTAARGHWGGPGAPWSTASAETSCENFGANDRLLPRSWRRSVSFSTTPLDSAALRTDDRPERYGQPATS